jgi:hypothetical protein
MSTKNEQEVVESTDISPEENISQPESEEVTEAEGAQENEQEPEAESSDDDDHDPEWYMSEEGRNRTLAGIRKKAEEKAFKKAYQQATSDFSSFDVNNAGLNQAAQAVQQDPNQGNQYNQQQPQQTAGYNQVAQQPQVDQESYMRQKYIASLGRNKYEDWDTKITGVVNKANYEGDVAAVGIIAEAAKLPNGEDLVYKLASDPAAVNEIKKLQPMFWKDELYKLAQKPKTKPKVANKPVRELKAPPATGGGEMTWEERQRQAFKEVYGS